MLNYLFVYSNSTIKSKQSSLLKKSCNSSILILSLGGLMLLVVNLSLVSVKAHAQESSTVNISHNRDRVIKVGVLSNQGAEQTIAKWQPTMDYLTQKIPGYTFQMIPKDIKAMQAYAKENETDFYIVNSRIYFDDFQIILAQLKVSEIEDLGNTEQTIQVLENNLANQTVSS